MSAETQHALDQCLQHMYPKQPKAKAFKYRVCSTLVVTLIIENVYNNIINILYIYYILSYTIYIIYIYIIYNILYTIYYTL